MTIKRPHLITAATILFSAISVQAAQASPTACINSASLMEKSCFFEVKEEFNATTAKCGSIASDEDRMDCKNDARDDKSEAFETCAEQKEARLDACDLLGEGRYADPLVDENITFIDLDEIGTGYANNPYVVLQAGHTHVLRAEDEIIVVYATDEVRDIQGVLCRVVVDIAAEEEFDVEEEEWEYAAIEVTDDWFAQDTDRTSTIAVKWPATMKMRFCGTWMALSSRELILPAAEFSPLLRRQLPKNP